MERLSSCYFCGTTLDEPVKEYPVVPRELDPETDATVSLCPGCRRKLGEVVQRILAATDADISMDGASSSQAESNVAPKRGEEAQPRTEPEPSEPADSTADSQSDEPSRTDPDVQTSTDPSTDAPGEGPAADAASEPSSTEEAEGEADGALDPELSAFEYDKVMRLLENREFPVDVDEFVTVATAAYDVSASDVEAIIDAAADRGLVEREGEQLLRPDG